MEMDTEVQMIRRKSLADHKIQTGASETRTRDLLHAMQTRSQLRHGPVDGDYYTTRREVQPPPGILLWERQSTPPHGYSRGRAKRIRGVRIKPRNVSLA